ncbi:MAG TPA: alpha-amylase family glycosyl hydrolase, partial [Mycobacteriales bacterium]|nr:alpha-amylase family glycosyl hydrolase [Mycobacteriales bacterium]
DPASIEAGFFLFGRHPEDYACWCGVRSLPKLDHRNAELRRRLYGGPDSVIARWLAPPYRLDGWRVDVANMTGRYQDVDLTHQIAREIRRTLGETNPDAYLLAEHAHDATDDLDGDGWHGTMNYAGFTRPVWQWLAEPGVDVDFNHQPGGLPVLPGTAVAATVREVTASMSWRAAAASVSLLDSHDTARFRTVVGADPDRVRVGLGLLATMPGVPLVFAGAEVGQLGVDGEDSRRPFPWDEAAWDRRTYDDHRDLLALRRAHPALRHGGLRWLHVGADTLVYLRETPQERLLIQASRAAHPPVPLPAALGPGEPVYGADPFKDAGVLPGSGPAFRVWQLD